MIVTIVSFIIVYTIIVLVHEGGHFLFSLLANIQVLELGLGLGPRVMATMKNGTRYSLNLLPLGGYIRLAGMNPEEENELGDEAYPANLGYMAKGPFDKFKSVAGGPVMNILFGFLAFLILFSVVGTPTISNQIGAITPNSPADRAGIKMGDTVSRMNGKPVKEMRDIIEYIHGHPGEKIMLGIARANQTYSIPVVPLLDPKLKVGLIGFTPKLAYQKAGILSAIQKSIIQTTSISIIIVSSIIGLITGKISIFELAGPLGIARATGEYAKSSFPSLIQFMAFLSINLGVVNLLPIPALDGGRLVFIIIESIRGKAIDLKQENKIHSYGFIFLISLIVIVTAGDIFKIVFMR